MLIKANIETEGGELIAEGVEVDLRENVTGGGLREWHVLSDSIKGISINTSWVVIKLEDGRSGKMFVNQISGGTGPGSVRFQGSGPLA